MVKDYYIFRGYFDGSGCPKGIIIKCYSREQAEYRKRLGLILEKITGEGVKQ